MNTQVENGQPGAIDPPPRPDNNLVGAILSTLCCCLPFGIVSIVYAAQVNPKYSAGDYVGAADSAAKSTKWMWWGVGIGLVVNLLYVLASLSGEV